MYFACKIRRYSDIYKSVMRYSSCYQGAFLVSVVFTTILIIIVNSTLIQNYEKYWYGSIITDNLICSIETKICLRC